MSAVLINSVRTRLATQLDSLTHILEWVPVDCLRRDRGDAKWTIHDNVAHLARHHQIMLDRITLIRSKDNPSLDRYRAETDTAWPAMAARPTDDVVRLLSSSRSELIGVVDRLSSAELARCGVHPALGGMDIPEWLDFFLVHEAHHLYTIRLLAGPVTSADPPPTGR